MTYKTSNVNKQLSSPALLIFSQFHRHILKNRTMLFKTPFISVSKRIGVGLKKQAAVFYFNFTQRRVVRYSCFDLFEKMKVFSAIWAMKYLFNISNKTYCTLPLCWKTEDAKFPKHLFQGLKYLCRLWLLRPTTLYRGINPYGAGGTGWVAGQESLYITKGFYGSKMKLLHEFTQSRASNICKCGISKPCWYMLSHLQNLSYVNGIHVFWNWFGLKFAYFINAGHSNNG